MKVIAAGLLVVLALSGCVAPRSPTGEQQNGDLVAASVSKAALCIFDTDFIDYDVPVGTAFSETEIAVLRGRLCYVVPMIERALGREDSVWGAKLAAHFGIKELLPLLRSHFFTPKRCYGWEGPDYSNPESYLLDEQYMYSLTYLEAIQKIAGKSINEAMRPDAQESALIVRHARDERSEFHHGAIWMMRKLKIERESQG